MIQVIVFAIVFATVVGCWRSFFRWIGPKLPKNRIDYDSCLELGGIVSSIIAADPQIRKKFIGLINHAPNFVCLKYTGTFGDDLEVRLRRVNGKTESDLLTEARIKIELLEQKLKGCGQ